MGDLLVPLIVFALVGSFSPGPNNLMVTVSGTAFGFGRTVPHMLGVAVGFAVMVMAFGLGLAQVFAAYPQVHRWLRFVGAAYLIYLALRIAFAGDPDATKAARRPLRFVEAGLFQWLNPKAWTLVFGVVATFTTVGGNLMAELAVIAVVFMVAILPSLAVWCLFGVAIARFMGSPRTRRIVNLAMAGLVALSVILLFL
jgi:threonine/homoserine/homoserine lactone efflux protein